jgi:hypothetical protein
MPFKIKKTHYLFDINFYKKIASFVIDIYFFLPRTRSYRDPRDKFLSRDLYITML